MPRTNETVDSFVDMVLGEDPETPEEPVEELTDEEVIEAGGEVEELPAGDDHEVTPVEEGDEKAELYEFTIGDEVYEVPEALRDQLQMAEDYTQKTQALSADRKALEAVQASNKLLADQFEFAQSVQDEVNQYQGLQSQINQWREYKRQNIESMTPTDFIKIDAAVEELQIQAQAIQDSLTTKQTEFHQAQEQSKKELLDASNEALRSAIPNWDDGKWGDAKTFGQSIGFTGDELDQVIDPRARQVLWYASQYIALKDKTATSVAKVKAAPAIQPTARKTMPQETQDRLNLRKKLKSSQLTPQQKRKLVQEDIGRRFG